MVLIQKRVDLDQIWERHFFAIRVVKHWHKMPREVLNTHAWKHSRSGWTRLWATWSSWRCPCSLQDGRTRWPLKVPSNPKYSVILWLYELKPTNTHLTLVIVPLKDSWCGMSFYQRHLAHICFLKSPPWNLFLWTRDRLKNTKPMKLTEPFPTSEFWKSGCGERKEMYI